MTLTVRNPWRAKLDAAEAENRRLRFEIRLSQLQADGYKRNAVPADAGLFATEKCETCDHVGLGVHVFQQCRNGSVVSHVALYHCPACHTFGEF